MELLPRATTVSAAKIRVDNVAAKIDDDATPKIISGRAVNFYLFEREDSFIAYGKLFLKHRRGKRLWIRKTDERKM